MESVKKLGLGGDNTVEVEDTRSHCGVFRNVFAVNFSMFQKLVDMGVNRLITRSKYEAITMERINGIVATRLGCDPCALAIQWL